MEGGMPSNKPKPVKVDRSEKIVSKRTGVLNLSMLALTFASGLRDQIEKQPALIEQSARLADDVRITVIPKTRSGIRLQDLRGMLQTTNLDEVRPTEKVVDQAVARLEGLGFKILRVGRFGITVSGPAAMVQEALKVNLCVFA